jgi:hypothetical protein
VAAAATTGGFSLAGFAGVEHPATTLSKTGRQPAIHARRLMYEM